jgi:KaiC/GvpD/RAD55 family RecA-like ATPase
MSDSFKTSDEHPVDSRGDWFTVVERRAGRFRLVGELGMSHVADNVVLLQHVQDGTRMRRALTVLKSRGSVNSAVISEFTISADGIKVGEPIDMAALDR